MFTWNSGGSQAKAVYVVEWLMIMRIWLKVNATKDVKIYTQKETWVFVTGLLIKRLFYGII